MSIKAISLENFSDEILLHVLKQGLDIPDLKNVRLVGKKWYKLASEEGLWITIALKINSIQLPESNIFFCIKNEVELCLAAARNYKRCYQSAELVGNWVKKNIIKDADITVKSINDLIEELIKEIKWKIWCYPLPKQRGKERSQVNKEYVDRIDFQTIIEFYNNRSIFR